MHCEARVADFNGNLEGLLKTYSQGFFRVPVGRPEVHKYSLVKTDPNGTYFLVVSNQDGPFIRDYNFIATVMGPDKSRAKEIMADFERKMPVDLRPAPDSLQKTYDEMMETLLSNL